MTTDEVVEVFGFAPESVSKRVRCFGVIEDGPRRGYLCVFTDDTQVDEHAIRKPNFADADRGYDASGTGLELVYIFAPRRSRRPAA